MIRRFLKGMLVSTAWVSLGHAFGGAYAGADLGGGYASIRHRSQNGGTTGKSTKKAFGGVYGVHAGYLYEIGSSRTIIGGEIYANSSSMNPKFSFGSSGQPAQGTVKIKRTVAIGGALLIGKMFNLKTMIYGRIAYEVARFHPVYKFNAASTNSQFAGKSIKKNVSATTPVLGVGLAYKFMRTIIVGAEYQLAAFYGNKKVIKDTTFSTQIHPVEHRLLLRVSFAFG
jgi:hypothetical protein